MTPEQEIAYGEEMRRLARMEGHRPRHLGRRVAGRKRDSKLREKARDYVRRNPDYITARIMASAMKISIVSARRFCREFQQEGWLHEVINDERKLIFHIPSDLQTSS